jgi:hypothetical protein
MRGHPQMAAWGGYPPRAVRGGATRQELLKSVLPDKSLEPKLRYHETAQHTVLLAQGKRSWAKAQVNVLGT